MQVYFNFLMGNYYYTSYLVHKNIRYHWIDLQGIEASHRQSATLNLGYIHAVSPAYKN